MSEDIHSMTESDFHEALRQAKKNAWDEGYEEGSWDGRFDANSEPSFFGRQKKQRNPYEGKP